MPSVMRIAHCMLQLPGLLAVPVEGADKIRVVKGAETYLDAVDYNVKTLTQALK